jgi:transposase
MLVEIDVRVREQLDIVPEQIRVIRHEYPVYACPTCDQSIKVAPAPLRIISRGLFTEAALAWLVVAKFADGLPVPARRHPAPHRRRHLAWHAWPRA